LPNLNALIQSAEREAQAVTGVKANALTTAASPSTEEKDYQNYLLQYAVTNPENPAHHYDYRSAYRAGVKPIMWDDLPKEVKEEDIQQAITGERTGRPMSREEAIQFYSGHYMWPDQFKLPGHPVPPKKEAINALIAQAAEEAQATLQGTETEYHPWGAAKMTVYDALSGLSALPRTIGMGETARNVAEFYDKRAEADPDIREFKKASEQGRESIWTEALGSAGPTAMALGMRFIPYVGFPLAASYFWHLNKDEVKDLALAKGADEKTAERISWIGGTVNSALDVLGLEAIAGKMPFLRGPVKSVKHRLVGAAVRLMASTGGEGLTEGMQEVVGELSSEYAASKDVREFLDRVSQKQWWDKALAKAEKSLKVGSMMGAVFGGAASVAETRLQKRLKPEKATKPLEAPKDLSELIEEAEKEYTEILQQEVPRDRKEEERILRRERAQRQGRKEEEARRPVPHEGRGRGEAGAGGVFQGPQPTRPTEEAVRVEEEYQKGDRVETPEGAGEVLRVAPAETSGEEKLTVKLDEGETVEVSPAEEKVEKPSPPPEEVDEAAQEAEPAPTEAQKEAGNYKKGHINIQGMDISIENPKGSIREGVDKQGKKWKSKVAAHYGYIRRTEGKDGDQVDVFIGPRPETNRVFVIDQVDPETGLFDEHKAMVGFPTKKMAKTAYLRSYTKDWKGLGAITEMTVNQFKDWIRTGDSSAPLGLKEKRKVAKDATRGAAGNLLIKTSDQTIYESRQPVHALMLGEFGVKPEDVIDTGLIDKTGKEMWAGSKEIKPLTEEVAAAVREQRKREQQKKRAQRAAKAKTFRQWVALTGGINPQDKTWRGEIRDMRYTMNAAGKKVPAPGWPVGIWNRKARGVDERTHDAIEAGWLPTAATEDDFMQALEQNITTKITKAGAQEDVDTVVKEEEDKLEQEYERELARLKVKIKEEWDAGGQEYTPADLEGAARELEAYLAANERDEIKAASIEELEEIWRLFDEAVKPEPPVVEQALDEAWKEISQEDQDWLDKELGLKPAEEKQAERPPARKSPPESKSIDDAIGWVHAVQQSVWDPTEKKWHYTPREKIIRAIEKAKKAGARVERLPGTGRESAETWKLYDDEKGLVYVLQREPNGRTTWTSRRIPPSASKKSYEDIVKQLEAKGFYGTIDRLKRGLITLDEAHKELLGARLKIKVVPLNPEEFAAELKAKGVGRQESWSHWIRKTGLKPGMDAKDWYKIYDSVTLSKLEAAQKPKEVEKAQPREKAARPALELKPTEPTPQERVELLRAKGEIEKPIKAYREGDREIIKLPDGRKLIRGRDSEGRIYYEVEGSWEGLKELGFDPETFTIDQAKAARVFQQYLKPKAAIPKEKVKPPTTGKQKSLLAPEKGETLDIFERGVDKIGESGAQYIYAPTTPQEQYSLFDFKPAERQEDRKVPPRRRVRVSTTGRIRAAGELVSGPEDVAALLAFLRKSPQEFLYTVTTDKEGGILEIHKYAKGHSAGAIANPVELAGRILNIPGASEAYLVHNHPTGDPKPGKEDYQITSSVRSLLEAGDVELTSLILGGTEYVEMRPGEVAETTRKIRPRIRKISLPVKERSLLLGGAPQTRIVDSEDALKALKEQFNNDDGVMLLDRKNRVLAFVPFIKGRSMKQTTADVLRIAEATNASGMIVNNSVLTQARSDYVNALWNGIEGLTIVDVFWEAQSWASRQGRGKGPTKYATLLSETKLALRGEQPYRLSPRQFRNIKRTAKLVHSWLEKAGAPPEVLERIDVELKPIISLSGKNIAKSVKEWQEQGMGIRQIFGATTFDDYRAIMELALSLQNLKGLERTTYHEYMHVAQRWLLTKSDAEHLIKYFGSEEAAADAFAEFMVNRSSLKDKPNMIRAIMMRLRRYLQIIRNGLKGQGFTRPEDIWGKMVTGQYVPHFGAPEIEETTTAFSLAEPPGKEAEVEPRIVPTKHFSGTFDDWNRHVIETWEKYGGRKGTFQAEEKKYEQGFSRGSLGPLRTLGEIWKNRKAGWKAQKPDTTVLDRLISVPAHHFEKVPALRRMYEAALARPDTYYEYLNLLTKNSKGEYLTKKLEDFRKRHKQDYAKVKAYLVNRDRNQIGYRVEKDEGSDLWKLRKPNGQLVGSYDSEAKAWGAAVQMEAQDLRKRGFPDQAVDAVVSFRLIMHKGFNILSASMREIISQYEESGTALPSVAVRLDNKRVEVDLKTALAMMGDMRGYYFPRIRRPGRFVLYAEKKGENPIMEFFDTKTLLAKRHTELQRKGYTVTKDLSPKMPEDVFEMAGQVIAMQAQINQALERIHARGLSLEDFNLQWTDRMVRPGLRDFVITGPTSKRMTRVFKELGGKFYSAYEGEPRAWHFYNPGPNFDKKVAKALANSVGIVDQEVQVLFAKAMAEQVANIIKGRGHRAHMIQRQMAKGKDVWIGYEEDPAIAAAKYASGLAAGEAKRIAALDMVRAFTGTDITWQQYKTLEGEDATYEEWLNMVEDRRVNPTKQPNAFREGKAYLQDVLRNEEWIDRFVGTVKGVAVLKYLGGRISAPLVNLTAMVTSVPAAMEGIAGIPIHKTFRLIGNASRLYGHYKFGDKDKLPQHVKDLFEEIEQKGWHKSQYNREALSVLESKLGRGWNRAIEWAMLGFGATEQLNRVSTIAGTYLGLKLQTPQGSFNHDEALRIAKEVSDKAHGVYGKANIPYLARGANPAAQIARMFYVFRTFSHNYLLTMKRVWGPGWKPEHAKAFSWMLLSPAVLAGTGATVSTPIITAIAQALGIGGEDPEEKFYDWLNRNFGEYAERFGRFGAFGLAGVSLKGSLQIGITDIPTTIPEILGAPGSVISETFYRGPQSILRGDVLKGIENELPLFMAGIVKAYRETTEGVTTRNNAPVFWGNEPLLPETIDALYRALSFNPARIAGIREKQWKERRIEQKYREMRTDIYAKIKRFYLRPLSERSKADWLDIIAEIQDYNEAVRAHGLERLAPLITRKSIRNNIRRAFRPPKRERLRQAMP